MTLDLLQIEPFSNSTPLLPDAAALQERASEEGYVFFRRLLDPSAVLKLRQRVLEICRKLEWLEAKPPLTEGIARSGVRASSHDDRLWPSFQCEVLVLPEFVELGLDPLVLGILETLYGRPALPHRGDTCRAVFPGALELTTLPHQDHYYVRGSVDLWTVWVPLGDCPTELGGLAVLPGSHRRGLLFHAGEGSGKQGVWIPEEMVWMTIDYACGDVLMFNSLTVHRACPNRTKDRLRISADYRYEPMARPTSHGTG